MCLRPLNIRSRADKINLDGGQSLFPVVACGKCAECQSIRRNEYYLRSYYQSAEVLDAGGYVYFDTLTYKDECLPRFSRFVPEIKDSTLTDFPCFDYTETRLFFVRLRKRLRGLGYTKDCFKYFLSSEYGTSENCTHRPHYHVIFYVLDGPDLFTFSKLVSDCWPFGRTDGLPYKSRLYIKDHCFSRLATNLVNLPHLENLCLYVAKYVNKSSSFDATLSRRIEFVCTSLVQRNLITPDAREVTRRSLYRVAAQFHRQSQGFGLYALGCADYNDIFSSGKIRVPTSNGFKYYPLPCYFERKLFYNLVREDGKYRWVINSEGERYKIFHADESCNRLAMNLGSWRENLSDDDKIIVDDYLDGRSLKDFASYLLFFKGRLKPFDRMLDSSFNPCSIPLNAWSSYVFNHRSGIVVDSDSLLLEINKILPSSQQINNLDDFFKDCVISQNSHLTFRNYDDLFSFYSSSLHPINRNKQEIAAYIDYLKERHKAITNNIKPI